MPIQTSVEELTEHGIIEEHETDLTEGVTHYNIADGHMLVCNMGSHGLDEIVDFINMYHDGVVQVVGQYHDRQFSKGVKLELRIFRERPKLG